MHAGVGKHACKSNPSIWAVPFKILAYIIAIAEHTQHLKIIRFSIFETSSVPLENVTFQIIKISCMQPKLLSKYYLHPFKIQKLHIPLKTLDKNKYFYDSRGKRGQIIRLGRFCYLNSKTFKTSRLSIFWFGHPLDK